jgi:hypothetical protein
MNVEGKRPIDLAKNSEIANVLRGNLREILRRKSFS